jgi:hypothetical protein
MKKLILFSLVIVGLHATPPQLEVKLGYFYFGDHKFRKIYHQHALDTQLTASGPAWNWLRVYGGINYISREGKSIGGHHRTEIMFLPVSLGVQALFEIARDVNFYLTLGPRYFYVHQENHYPGISRSVNCNSVGGFGNTGFQVSLDSHFLFDFFAEYSYSRVGFKSKRQHVSSHTRQVGGLTIGGGIGYQF